VKTTGIIILAAGSSSRLGYSKQLLKLQGQALLTRAINTAANVPSSDICVVLGANADEHIKVLANLPVQVIHNERWNSGIGSSIRTGINFFQGRPTIDKVIITVCDQPFVTTTHLCKLVEEHHRKGKAIVASGYAGELGVPALFTRSVFSELVALEGQVGAKMIILRDPSRLSVVPLDKGEIDIDTDDDVKRWIENEP
jgi:molybdenum cofactor cytidylyltransferase